MAKYYIHVASRDTVQSYSRELVSPVGNKGKSCTRSKLTCVSLCIYLCIGVRRKQGINAVSDMALNVKDS